MTLRVAIVGCGKAAENHAAEIRRRSDAELVAACDSEWLMAEQFSLRHGAGTPYSNFTRMLEEQRPDVVHITTPPQSHCSLALESMDAGCHVFVEKPLAENRESAAEMLERAEQAGCKLTVGWTYYFDPVVRSMREMVAQDVIGDAVHLEAFQAYDLHGNFGRAVLQDSTHWVHQLNGGLLHNNLDHLFSLIVEFVRGENSIFCVNAWRATDSPYANLVDELRLTVADENTSAQIGFSCRTRPLGHFLTIMGTKSTIRLNIANQTISQDRASNLPGALGKLSFGFDQTRQAAARALRNCGLFLRSDFQALPGLTYLLSAFYDSIEHDHEVPIPYEQILRVTSWMDKVVSRLEQPKVVYQ